MQINLRTINRSPWYWLGLVLFATGAMAVALYFQYAHDEWPCLLCIQTRIWVMGVAMVGLTGFSLRHRWQGNALAHGLLLFMAAGLLDRSLVLLGTERGTLFGECAMELGLPAWFALDKWFPLVFEVQASCGYTPELWSGFSMAEALVIISIGLLVLAGLQLLLSLLIRLGRI